MTTAEKVAFLVPVKPVGPPKVPSQQPVEPERGSSSTDGPSDDVLDFYGFKQHKFNPSSAVVS